MGRHGDYADLSSATPESVHADLAGDRDGHLRVLGWFRGEAVGRFDLISRDSQNVVIAYWLGEAFTGRGLATVACAALLRYAKTSLGATDAWAGVTQGKTSSAALLARLGFEAAADMGHDVRYHRAMAGPVG